MRIYLALELGVMSIIELGRYATKGKCQSVCFLVAVVITVLAVSPCFGQRRNDNDKGKGKWQFSVGAEAEVKVVPDQVVIVLTATSIDSVLTKSKAKNDMIVQGFSSAAARNSVNIGDVKTDFIHIEPTYETIQFEKVFMGYTIKRKVIITLCDLSKFDNLYAELVEAGATNLDDVQFQTTELRKYRDEARAAAVKAAIEKAELFASSLDVKLIRPLGFGEGSNRWCSWDSFNNDNNPRISYSISQNSVSETPSEDFPTAIGRISVKASVNITFEVE
jgi:uncharacterized protein